MGWGKAAADERLTAEQAFGRLTLDDLRPLAALVDRDPPKKKADLVPLLARSMTDPGRVRAVYDHLDPIGQNAVRDVTDDRGMAELGQRVDLAVRAAGLDRGLDLEHLHGGRCTSLFVARAIHDTHSARTDRSVDPEPPLDELARLHVPSSSHFFRQLDIAEFSI